MEVLGFFVPLVGALAVFYAALVYQSIGAVRVTNPALWEQSALLSKGEGSTRRHRLAWFAGGGAFLGGLVWLEGVDSAFFAMLGVGVSIGLRMILVRGSLHAVVRTASLVQENAAAKTLELVLAIGLVAALASVGLAILGLELGFLLPRHTGSPLFPFLLGTLFVSAMRPLASAVHRWSFMAADRFESLFAIAVVLMVGVDGGSLAILLTAAHAMVVWVTGRWSLLGDPGRSVEHRIRWTFAVSVVLCMGVGGLLTGVLRWPETGLPIAYGMGCMTGLALALLAEWRASGTYRILQRVLAAQSKESAAFLGEGLRMAFLFAFLPIAVLGLTFLGANARAGSQGIALAIAGLSHAMVLWMRHEALVPIYSGAASIGQTAGLQPSATEWLGETSTAVNWTAAVGRELGLATGFGVGLMCCWAAANGSRAWMSTSGTEALLCLPLGLGLVCCSVAGAPGVVVLSLPWLIGLWSLPALIGFQVGVVLGGVVLGYVGSGCIGAWEARSAQHPDPDQQDTRGFSRFLAEVSFPGLGFQLKYGAIVALFLAFVMGN